MSLIQELKIRGFIKDVTHGERLEAVLSTPQTIYCGFDLTAQSLHIGNLIPLTVLKIFKKYGHKIIVIFGGATTKIGDPSGKDEMRKMLTPEQILENKKGIMHSVAKFIHIDENVKFLDNSDWLSNISYIDFLRETGAHFRVNQMLTMDSVKNRLSKDDESGMSFIEFNYILMQSYDFYHLYKNYGCNIQIGGSEQWGNIVNGIDLIRKKCGEKSESFGITLNLVTRSDGKKMGKSEAGAIWLNSDKTSPYEYFQYFRNVPDADVEKFLALFTDFDIGAIAKNVKMDINEQKKILAFEATKICHGENEAINARERARLEFELGSGEASEELFYVMPGSVAIVDVLFDLKLFQSKGECKKVIRAGGVKIDGLPIDETLVMHAQREMQIAIGKKKKYKLILK